MIHFFQFAQLNETGCWFDGASLRKLPDPVVLLDESTLPAIDLDPTLILNYPLRPNSAIDYAAFDPIEIEAQGAGPDAM